MAKLTGVYQKLTSKEVLAPALVVAVLCAIALIAIASSNGKIGKSVRDSVIRGGLLTAFLIGIGRIMLGVVGWPLWILTGVSFVFSGGWNAVAKSTGLPQIPGTKGYEGSDDQKSATALCAQYGGFSHWVSPAENCRRSAQCDDGIHFAHLDCE